MRRVSQRGIGLGDGRSQIRRVGLTEIVEMMLSARDVGGFPPPIATNGEGYMRVAQHSCCGEIEVDRKLRWLSAQLPQP